MCDQEWRTQPLAGAMLLPNLGALARGVAAATGGPGSQGPELPPASQMPRRNDEAGGPDPPHEVHKVHFTEDIVRTILSKLGDADDPDAACATVESFCGTDTFRHDVCGAGAAGPQNPWHVITERIFKSTDVDKALFAHDELLKTDPKKAFKLACKDHQIARAAGLDWLSSGLQRVHRTRFYEWLDEGADMYGEGTRNGQIYDLGSASANQIMTDFYKEEPVFCKVHEWSLVTKDEYDRDVKPTVKEKYEKDFDPRVVDDHQLNWIGEAALGETHTYLFRDTSLTAILIGRGVEEMTIAPPTYADRFAHAERRVRPVAPRVGRAMVFAFHKNANLRKESAVRLGILKTIETYVASEPRVLP